MNSRYFSHTCAAREGWPRRRVTASCGRCGRKVPALARAAVATGNVDGVFFEVHPNPDSSPSDGPNMVKLDEFERVLDGVLAVHAAARKSL